MDDRRLYFVLGLRRPLPKGGGWFKLPFVGAREVQPGTPESAWYKQALREVCVADGGR